jgi:hypothetical protein
MHVPPGLVVREADMLTLAVTIDPPHGFTRRARVPLVSGLPACGNEESVGFTRWAITLGEGREKRTLREFTIENRR